MHSGFEVLLSWLEEFFDSDFLYSMESFLSQKVVLGNFSISVLSLLTINGLIAYVLIAIVKWVIG